MHTFTKFIQTSINWFDLPQFNSCGNILEVNIRTYTSPVLRWSSQRRLHCLVWFTFGVRMWKKNSSWKKYFTVWSILKLIISLFTCFIWEKMCCIVSLLLRPNRLLESISLVLVLLRCDRYPWFFMMGFGWIQPEQNPRFRIEIHHESGIFYRWVNGPVLHESCGKTVEDVLV